MEKNIKFRGRKSNGKWLYGDLLRWYGNTSIISFRKKEPDLLNKFGSKLVKGTVIPDTVGQFIGKQDADGKDIYEGDIITCNWKYPKIVQYRNEKGAFCIANISDLSDSDIIDIWQVPVDGWWKYVAVHVVGNIYDDKDFISSYQGTVVAKSRKISNAFNYLADSVIEHSFLRKIKAMFVSVKNWFKICLKK